MENITGIDFLLHIVQTSIVSIGDDGTGLCLEGRQVVDHPAAKEQGSVRQGRFVNNDLGSLGLDAFHHSLDGTLAEIVAVALHREAVDAYYRDF